MPQVAIPARHFTHNVKKNYQYPDKALVREFLQNSVDAGSTTIDFIFDESGRQLTVIDDGCGMSKEVLIDALLTMSGSHKGENSIGGFGAAKEILLFQHESYFVRTKAEGENTVTVSGSQLDYDFVTTSSSEDNYRIDRGTCIEIVFHEDYDLSNFDVTARHYLGTCNPSAIVRWNNEAVMPHVEKGDLVPLDNDWCDVYALDTGTKQYYAYIRINGVTMFEAWVSDTQYTVIIELTKPSLEILTINRDGFTHSYNQHLSKLIYQISVEKGAFGKAYNTSHLYRGQGRDYDDIMLEIDSILEKIDKKFSEHAAKVNQHFAARQVVADATFEAMEEVRQELEADAEAKRTQSDVAERLTDKVKGKTYYEDVPDNMIEDMIQELVCDHVADFHIKVTSKKIDEIPTHLQPGNWGKATINMAKQWKHCVKLAMRANGIVVPYTVGWVLDDSETCYALYERNEDGTSIFYMNPQLTWMRSSNHSHVFLKMLMTACHEVCHIHREYHDEIFMQHYEEILHRTMCLINRKDNSWWKEYQAAKHEVI